MSQLTDIGVENSLTLVVCLKGKDGLVLAADSRGIAGDPKQLTSGCDTALKLFQLSKYVGILVYGQLEFGSGLIHGLRNIAAEKGVYFSDILLEARRIARESVSDWFKNVQILGKPEFGFILCGLEKDGEPQMCYLANAWDFAPQLVDTGIGVCGLPQLAQCIASQFYRPNLSQSYLVRLAVRLISETAKQDARVGGSIKAAEITKENGFNWIDPSSIQRLVEENNQLDEELDDRIRKALMA